MALVVNKKEFNLGLALALTFFALLFIINTTAVVSIEGKSMVDYGDQMFVSVSKGSVYFIPEVIKKSSGCVGRPLDVTLKGDQTTALLFEKAGAKVTSENGKLKIEGDLGNILQSALKDADAIFKGDLEQLNQTYGFADKEIAHAWWLALKELESKYQKAKKFDETNFINAARVKALEPAFNFYGVQATSVSEHALGISAVIVFYVLYTVWWGFAIFFLCEGVGLLMKKSKVKKEA